MPNKPINYQQLARNIKAWALELGFAKVGITDINLAAHEAHLNSWLEKHYHGEMDYMQKHGSKRSRPAELVPNTIRVICLATNYLPKDTEFAKALKHPRRAFISRYALGRDYHKVLAAQSKKLIAKIKETTPDFEHRIFVDSAPVLEKALAQKAGLGWFGKHSNLISRDGSSWFFLNEIYTDLPLPIDAPYNEEHCGSCTACIDICPTKAIVGPKIVDARKCISYLTIEHKGEIPENLRPLIGNRVYGCDDCQIVCPWNKYAAATDNQDFKPRNNLDKAEILDLFLWTEEAFYKKTEGSAIRRIGYERWLRNMAIGLGNAPYDEAIVLALKEKLAHPSTLINTHVKWALEQQLSQAP